MQAPPIDVQLLREVFDQFDARGRGSIEMWRMRELLAAAGLAPSDLVLFNLITEVDADGDGMLSFSEFLYFAQRLRESGAVQDSDMDLLSAWTVLGGAGDKGGAVKVARVKAAITAHGFTIDFDAALAALVARKNALNVGARKAAVPDEVDYEDFRALINDDQ